MDTMSTTVIYRVLYFLLDHVFTIYEYIENVWTNLVKKCLVLRHDFLPLNKGDPFLKITKTPRHLTVLLGIEEPSPIDLANLILWCLAANITFISFYDYKGSLRKKQEQLHLIVQEKKRASDHVIWHRNPDFVHKNGYVGRKIHVKVLSGDDGRSEVVHLTKKFAQIGETDIISHNFDSGLRKQFEFPDPDLGVCCGKTFSLFGYPPWHIAVTEFLTINTHHSITLDVFCELLHRYSRCEQRYGK